MANRASSGAVSGNTGKILFVVVAFIVAAGIVFWTIKSQQGYDVANGKAIQPTGSNIKLQAMKEMQGGKPAGSETAPAPGASSQETDPKASPGGRVDPMSLGDK